MKRKPFNKTLLGKTGKDLLNLSNIQHGNIPGDQGIQLPVDETEQHLFDIWKGLLGQKSFGVTNDFFKSGGNSLKAIQLISRISNVLLVELELADVFLNPTIQQLAALIQQSKKSEPYPSIASVHPRPAHIPLSFSQERLWFIDQLEGSIPYHIPAVLRLKGNLNEDALIFSLKTLIERHEVLRTVIEEREGQPYQIIRDGYKWELSVKDGFDFTEDSKEFKSFVQHLINTPFDLARDYMLRATLIHLSPEENMLVITLHHIASDGWSMPILINEIAEIYNSFVQGTQLTLAHLEIQYADYAIWQRKYLDGEVLNKKIDYWKSKLEGLSPLQLPVDYIRPAVQSTKGDLCFFEIDKSLSQKLQELSQQQGATLFMTLLAAFKVLLHRYSGQEDICVGTPIANRTQLEVESMIGFFVNTLALRSKVNSKASFIDLLQQVKATTIEAYDYQDVPFEKVVEVVLKERDLSRNPLFQVMFVSQNTAEITEMQLPGITLQSEPAEHNTAQFDITVSVSEEVDGHLLTVEYCTDIFTEQTINKMMLHYQVLLNAIVKDPQRKVGELQMLSEAEESQILKEFNHTKSAFPEEKTVITLFEEQVTKTPENTAVIFEDEQLSYKELNERANKVAHYLRSKGVREETLVPICIERSLNMIVGMLGILKAGGAYVPIDPDYPQDRINYMLEDTHANIVVTGKSGKSKLHGRDLFEMIDLENDWSFISEQSEHNLLNIIEPTHLAYVIYTSGSTGWPKGVMIEHASFFNYVSVFKNYFSINAYDFVLQQFSISFDTSVEEIFPALISGASVCIIKEGGKDVNTIKQYIENNQATILSTTPMVIDWLNKELVSTGKLRYFILGGDVLFPSSIDQLFGRVNIVNGYGPTETTVCATYNKIEDISATSLLGRPIETTSVYIMGEENALVPIGVTGEIVIGGVQVARGYLNRPELTAEKFFKDPYHQKPGATLYKTGDLGRWLPDGNVEFLGRKDDQVKIRGYRIELGEIESVLQQSGMIEQSVVVACIDKYNNKRLVGYVVPKGRFDKEGMVFYLSNLLPDYMIPALWMELESLPLNVNGKVNKKALPEPEIDSETSYQYIAPRNKMEEKLAAIWQRLLPNRPVGIKDNFFELGGHSLLAMRLISAIRKELGLELALKDLYFHPTINELTDIFKEQETNSLLPIIEKIKDRPAQIPLSFSQERLWFIDQLEGSVEYHSPVVLLFRGDLNKAGLEAALHSIIMRHEVLRTVFVEEGGRVYQSVSSGAEWTLELINGSGYRHDREGLNKYARDLIRKPFDLSKDFMLRASLISVDEQEYMLVVTMHHIASDAWSLSVLVKEVVELYSSFAEQRPAHLTELELQYADYAIWQRGYLQGEILNKELGYWKEKLEGVSALNLPTDYLRPATGSSRGASVGFNIDKVLSAQLQEISRQQGATIFMTLLSIFKVLLYRYSGQADISVGTSIANRPQQEVEGLVGYFVNTLALRSELSGEQSFMELLQQVKSTTLGAYEHQDVPFEKVVEAVVKERSMNRSPLFQVMLVLFNTPEVSELHLSGVELSVQDFDAQVSKFDITYFIAEIPGGLQCSIEYSTDLFNAATIENMMAHYQQLLNAVVKDIHQKIGQLPMLTQPEHHQLLEEFNTAQVDYPKDKSVVAIFEEQVLQTPGSTALVFEGETMTYEQLNNRANQLAHYLISRGVTSETLVPLYVERGLEMMVGMLGIMKAGGAYVPIDTDFPPERIGYMLEDTGAKIIVSSSNSSGKLEIEAGVAIIETDNIGSDLSKENLSIKPLASQLAYVIYTSGSTGKPKGVMIEHRSLLDYYYGLNKYTPIAQSKSFALVSTIATDLGNTVIYAALLSGGALHLFTKETVSNIEALHNYFADHKIDCLKIVPSHWKALSQDDGLLLPKKLLVFGGEALPSDTAEEIRSSGSGCLVVNHYGPTETTIGKLLHVVSAANTYEKTIPIGKPFSNTKVYVLSQELQPCPVGVPGQLYISGDGVAKGYYNNAALTKEKFIINPFNKEREEWMYATGDQVKFLPDGNIAFLGRVDDQVKIRGYRIELGEIEAILQQVESVSQAVVLAKDDKQGNKRLVGYIVPRDEFDKEAIVKYLKEKLPDYMIPGVLVELETLPLTANGKVDRKALPDPEAGESASGQYVAPRNETETKLAAIWEDVLEVEQVGVHDDFFELGGHSLLAVRLISAIRKAFNVEMPIGDIFDYPTIAQLAGQVQKPSEILVLPVVAITSPRPERIPLSFSQERLWFLDRLEGTERYHLPAVFRLTGKPDIEALTSSLRQVINRHEVLRTVVLEEAGSGYQQIKDQDNWQLQIVDGLVYKDNDKGLQQYIKQCIDQPFDLSKDYMLRATLITLGEAEQMLVVTMHHIASDGWSNSIIVKELVELYNASIEKRTAVLPALPIQYADFAIWQRNYLKGDTLEKKLGYWREKLEGVPSLQLPTDYPRPTFQSTNGASTGIGIDKALSEKLLSFSHQKGVSLFMTLLSAYNILLYRYTGQQDISVGTPAAGRQQAEVEGLVGFFINTLVLRTGLDGNMSFNDLLQQVRTTTLEAYAHQEVPFEKVVDAVVNERDMSRSPLFQVVLVLQNTPGIEEIRMGDVKLSDGMESAPAHTTSKFELTFTVTEMPEGLSLAVEYCTDLYTEQTIHRMMNHFEGLLTAVMQTPDKSIGRLPMLTKSEKQQLLFEFNDTASAYPAHQSIVEVFEEQAANHPERIAIEFEEQQLTYGELNERANKLAHYLQKRGLKPGAMVPVCIERGIELMVGILGILKAGGAYVPIDAEYPADRIAYMIEDISANIFVTSSQSSQQLTGSYHLDTIELDSDDSMIETQPGDNISASTEPGDLAYVIYTSGSTGKPKGVMVTHQNVVSLVKGVDYVALTSEDVLLSTGSASFDATTLEYWGMLLNGGKLVLCTENKLLDIDLLRDEIVSRKVNKMWFTAGWFNQLVDTDITVFEGLESILVGGEKLSEPHIETLRQTYPAIEIINGYGPTENTTFSLTYKITATEINQPIPIGRPLNNRTAFVLNEFLGLVPVGVPGEIFVGGDGLSKGYLNSDDLTREKFIANPFNKEANEIIYKTGDKGRWLPGGDIEYLGRIDQQVKIRGFRIELGEIETVLLQHESVSQAVVVAREDKEGHKKLVGYLVMKEDELDRDEIVDYLKSRLPEYMVPAIWVEMENFPLTRNGKVDRNALPEPGIAAISGDNYVAPRNEIEEKLVAIWQDLLDLERVGIEDNFFELGGDSIISIQLVSRVKNAGYELQVADIFSTQTIAGISGVIEQRMGTAVASSGEQQLLDGTSGLLPIQQWYFEKNPHNPNHFNQSVLLNIDKKITEAVLQQVIERLMAFHDSLRFKYSHQNGEWSQQYGDFKGRVINEDIRSVSLESVGQLITEKADQYQRGLDISKGELVKIVWIQTPEAESENRLLVVIHHLAVDGVSWRILMEDMEKLIAGFISGAKVDLGPKTSSYRQWYQALEKYSKSNGLLSQLAYWQQPVQKYIALPVDNDFEGAVKVKDTERITVKLGEAQTRLLLQEIPKVYHTEINDILLAALAKTIGNWSGNKEVVIGLEGHGRENIEEAPDTSRTVGWFTSLYPVLLHLDDAGDEPGLIKSVKEQLRRVPGKGLGYGVLKYINKEKSLQGSAPWDIVFNYLGQLDNTVTGNNLLKLANESTGNSVDEQLDVEEKLAVNGMVQAGELVLNWTYSQLHFKDETVINLAAAYTSNLQKLVDHCIALLQKGVSVFTPNDFGLGSSITYQELDQFLATPFKAGKTRGQVVESMYRLSGLQQGMLFHGLYDNTSGSYMVQFCCDLVGVDLDAFRKSWDEVIARHTILRSAFYYDELSVPVQCVFSGMDMPLEMLDYRDMEGPEMEMAIKEYTESDRTKGFDFKTAPLMRISMIRMSEDRYRMLWTSHHILFDGWSLPVLMEEFLNAYELVSAGKKLPVFKPDRFEDYIRFIEQRSKEEEKLYWQQYLDGVETGSLLPFIETTAERNKGVGTYQSLVLNFDADTTAKINRFVQAERITVNTLVQGVWASLLHKYTGSDNIVFGVTVSGRPDELVNVEHRVGMFINTLPLHSIMQDDEEVGKWLRALQEEQVASRQFQYTPLNEIKAWTGIPGDLFDSLVVFENYPVSKVIEANRWRLQVENVETAEQTNYPLNILVHSAEEIDVRFSYNSSLLEGIYVEEIKGHFEKVLLQIIKSEKALRVDLKLLSAAEVNQVIVGFNDTCSIYPKDKSIVEVFEEQVAATPGKIALVFENESLSYEALNQRSNQLAHFLRSKGIHDESLIPVCIERSPEMIIGILGILKAGGAYVPIDSAYPAERISYMLEDTNANWIVTSKKSAATFSFITSADIIEMDGDELEIIKNQPTGNLSLFVRPNQLAYVIYTSGSTGKPKGTLIEHVNVVSLVKGIDYVPLTKEDILLSTGSPSFDATTFEYWAMLLNGGQLVLCSEDRLLNSELLKEEITERNVTMMWFTSSWFNQLVDSDITVFQGLKTILAGGEKLSVTHIEKMRKAHTSITLINGYGPTENTTFSTTCKINESNFTDSVPIGRPLNNRTAYILDGNMQPAAVGLTGEIYLGGAGLSRGYLNLPELTKEKFIENPLIAGAGAKIYRTGDLGCWMPDGQIKYLGRLDDQVKIRGYRIELGEIENVLQQSGLVSRAIVLANEDKPGLKRLVAYFVAAEGIDKEAIQAHLKSRLPEYMVPALWVKMEKIPLTSNGKVDKRSLPPVDASELLANEYIAPKSKPEEDLAGIWKELLGIETVGVRDNFFELGGDSILTIQIVSRAKRMGYDLQPKDIFIHQTIERLCEAIAERKSTAVVGEQGLLSGSSGLLPIQQWYLEMNQAANNHFNQSVLLGIDKSVTAAALENALHFLMQHHDALRFKYYQQDGLWQQEYGDYSGSLITKDLRTLAIGLLPSAIGETASGYQSSLHLERGELLRMVWMQTPEAEQQNRLFIVVHHLAIDGVSWRILLEDLELLLTGKDKDALAGLGQKSTSYRQWYNALELFGKGKAVQSQLSYWQQAVKRYEALPADREVTGPVKVTEMAAQNVQLSTELTSLLLKEVPRVYHTEINDILLTALAHTIAVWSNRDTVSIGLEGHGREEIASGIDTTRTIGWFTTLYPLSLEVKRNWPEDKLIKSVKEQLRQVPDKGLGFGVLRYINREATLSGSDPWDIVFNYLGQLDNVVKESKWFSLVNESTGSGKSGEQYISEPLSVSAMVQGGKLSINFDYSTRHFETATIQSLARSFVANLEQLIAHCMEQQKKGQVFTPSDFGLGADVSYEELDQFLEEDDSENIISF